MKKLALAIAALAIVASLLVYVLYTDRIEVIPGQVAGGSSLVDTQIKSTFEGVYSWSGVKSEKNGGACMIFQDANRPRPCASDTDCAIFDGYGYCVPEGGSSTCWFKPPPDEAHCLRGRLPGKYSLGPAERFPKVQIKKGPLEPAEFYGSDHAFWRVLTCLNVTPLGCNGGALNTNKIYKYGPIREIKDRLPLEPEKPDLKPSGEN